MASFEGVTCESPWRSRLGNCQYVRRLCDQQVQCGQGSSFYKYRSLVKGDESLYEIMRSYRGEAGRQVGIVAKESGPRG